MTTDNPEQQTPQAAADASQLAEQVQALQADLAAAQQKAQENLEGWQRSLAEFTNYKRRIERDQAGVYQNASASVIKRYLSISDDLERALKHRPTKGQAAGWAEGIELIYRKLQQLLENEGVKPMQAEGQMFDPTLHEAVVMEDSPNHESGQIIEVLQQGYLLGDRVLRPATVRVAR